MDSWSAGRLVACVLSGLALVSLGSGARADSLSGQVRVGIEGVSVAEAGAIVVFLESAQANASRPEDSGPTLAIRQHGARFEPAFVAVSVGQKIEMPNDDIIYHNVFSYSRPNDFDLGLYAAGESHAIHFDHPGLVRIYCSIHDEMDGLIFVAPSRLHAVAGPNGRYSIDGIPGGQYRLHVWSERLPELVRSVEIRPGEPAVLDVEIGRPASFPPSAAPGASAAQEG